MKISPEIYKQIKDDIAAIVKAMSLLDLTKDDDNLTVMWSLLAIVSHDRAYDDNHPTYVSGKRKRYLPYDGRDYCFYYDKDCNDSHVATALRKIEKELIAGV